MILFPAIDIRDGKAVRLVRGDYDAETIFHDDPLEAARRWLDDGALALHVVDLDGARSGEPKNLGIVEQIVAASEVPVQVGGGLRRAEHVQALLAAGAAYVVLGSAAVSDPMLVESLADSFGPQIAVGVDARSGKVAIQGWEQETGATAGSMLAEMLGRGVTRFVYTPVEVDGTLEGPGLDGLADLARIVGEGGGEMVYSGGVGSLDHLKALSDLDDPAITGVIAGRALYEGRFTVAEGQAVLSGRPAS